MAKIHPNRSDYTSSAERETFTVWMKSLVCHGNGCTVFNSRGEVVFRVDNYQQKCSRKVFLMDSTGNTLFSIYRKKLRIFDCWEGFKCSEGEKEKPWFKVRRNDHTMFKFNCRDISCRVNLERDENSMNYCRIIGLQGKSAFKIIDFSGQILAEAVEKQSCEGIPLGKDVVALMVEPHADLSLIMALVTIYGSINNTL